MGVLMGGIAQGFVQGSELVRRHQQAKEENDLQRKLLKLREDTFNLEAKKLQSALTGQESLAQMFEGMTIPGGPREPSTIPSELTTPQLGRVNISPDIAAMGERLSQTQTTMPHPLSGLAASLVRMGQPKEAMAIMGLEQQRPTVVPPGGTLVNPRGQQLFQSPIEGAIKPSFEQAQIGQALAQKLGRPPTPQEFIDEQQKMKMEAATGMPVEFSQGGLDLSAWQYLQTGVTPSMGFGARGTVAQVQVRNRAAEIAKTYGLTPEDILQGRTSVKAAQTALSGLERQAASVLSFAKTAEGNLSMAERLSGQVNRTGVPVFNRWIIAGKRSVTGDPDVAAFHAATRVAINEFARVTTSVTGGGITSDQARKEIEDILSTANTPEQFKQIAATLRIDMQNRIAGYQEGGNRIRQSLTGAFAPAGTSGQPGLVGPTPQQTPLPAPVQPSQPGMTLQQYQQLLNKKKK